MAWNQSAYTATGAGMLTETLSGRKLSITRAAGGMGTCEASELGSLTDVIGEQIALDLLGITDTEAEDEEGTLVPAKQVGTQITNKGLTETKILHQVGVYGKLDVDDTEHLIYVLQDERGIEVPSESENPKFAFDLYVDLLISHKSNIVLKVEPGGEITLSQVRQMIEEHNNDKAAHAEAIKEAIQKELGGTGTSVDEKIQNHDKDPNAHSGIIQQAMSQAVQQAVAQVSGMVGSAIVKEITIPAEGWALDETGSDEPYMGMDEYRYYVDVTDEEVTDDQVPIVALHKDALETAKQAGLCPTAQTVTGAVRFWARYEPMQDMAATLALLSASGSGQTGGGGTYVLPVATATTLGGVKLGEGFSTTPDGTLSYTGTGLPEDAFAQPDETQEMLDEVLPLA